MQSGKDTLFCSFCTKSQHEVRKLILAPDNAAICDDCINICVVILREEGIETPGKLAERSSQTDLAAILGELPDASPQTEFAAILEAIRRKISN